MFLYWNTVTSFFKFTLPDEFVVPAEVKEEDVEDDGPKTDEDGDMIVKRKNQTSKDYNLVISKYFFNWMTTLELFYRCNKRCLTRTRDTHKSWSCRTAGVARGLIAWGFFTAFLHQRSAVPFQNWWKGFYCWTRCGNWYVQCRGGHGRRQGYEYW